MPKLLNDVERDGLAYWEFTLDRIMNSVVFHRLFKTTYLQQTQSGTRCNDPNLFVPLMTTSLLGNVVFRQIYRSKANLNPKFFELFAKRFAKLIIESEWDTR
jgi:hypothetical protein